ncbi:hypothetical protein BJV77DRAFT_125464 [Russula vinacea]|nr:hypothetical protein BJV77DRAFT_125464 [Russula vinacea]
MNSSKVIKIELANKSAPAWVNADLLVPEHSHQAQASNSDKNQPVFSIPVGSVGHPLQPGPENVIKVRLDEGPMRLHWVNDSLTLLDAEGTLHAELHVKLTLPMASPVPPLSPDIQILGVKYLQYLRPSLAAQIRSLRNLRNAEIRETGGGSGPREAGFHKSA